MSDPKKRKNKKNEKKLHALPSLVLALNITTGGLVFCKHSNRYTILESALTYSTSWMTSKLAAPARPEFTMTGCTYKRSKRSKKKKKLNFQFSPQVYKHIQKSNTKTYQRFSSKLTKFTRHGCGKQQCLTLSFKITKYVLNVFVKSIIHHTVGLVQTNVAAQI